MNNKKYIQHNYVVTIDTMIVYNNIKDLSKCKHVYYRCTKKMI